MKYHPSTDDEQKEFDENEATLENDTHESVTNFEAKAIEEGLTYETLA